MKWIEGRVIEQKQWAPGLYSLFVEAAILPFQAGQFIQISLDKEDPSLHRPYSFVNAPSEPILEFYYDVIKGGKITASLSKLTPGESIWVNEKPAGRFVLEAVPAGKILWLFATGTGLGVFLSLLKTTQPWDRFQHIVLVHSVRLAHSLTHQALIQRWQEQYPQQFHWFPMVTGESQHGFFSERIPTVLRSGKLEAAISLTLTLDSQVMLCGNPEMVREVSHLLQDRGLTINRLHQPGQISAESYWKA